MQAGRVIWTADTARGERDGGQDKGIALAVVSLDCRVCVMMALWFLVEHVRKANSDEPANYEDHAEPFEPGEACAQEDGGEYAGEYDHGTTQHLGESWC